MKSVDFHPMRYRQERPFAGEFLQWWKRKVGRGPVTERNAKLIADFIGWKYDQALRKIPITLRPKDALVFTREVNLAVYAGLFNAWGQNIFLVPDRIRALLEQTDLSGVAASDVQLPFPSLYVSFGAGFDGALPGPPNRIDGAYVYAQHPDTLEVAVTSCLEGRRSAWPTQQEPYQWFGFDLRDRSRTFEELLDAEREKLAADLTSGWNGVRQQSEQWREGLSAAVSALTLAINVVCLINATSAGEFSTAYPDDAPETLRDEANDRRRRAGRIAREQLLERGYMPVRIVLGRESRSTAPEAATAGGREVSSHWRRGHWRRQPFGQGRAQRRLQWIRPTLVRADSGDPDTHPHLYTIVR